MSISTDARLRVLPFTLESELKEAAFNHGYRYENGRADGWLFFHSDTVPGEIALAASDTLWFLSVAHRGVAAELKSECADPPAGNGRAAFVFDNQSFMRAAISRCYQLSASLPTLPLERFEEQMATLGDTEVERLVRQRVGQDIFRSALMDYWQGRCPLTGITTPELLRASHIVPWADCESDAQRLDVHNGLLLAAHWDAAFDAGLVSFDEDGRVLRSSKLDDAARSMLVSADSRIPIDEAHQQPMAWHRQHRFVD